MPYEPTKLETARMALIMADGWLHKAKRYAKGQYIRKSTWERAEALLKKELEQQTTVGSEQLMTGSEQLTLNQ